MPILFGWLVGFVALRPKSTAMVIAGAILFGLILVYGGVSAIREGNELFSLVLVLGFGYRIAKIVWTDSSLRTILNNMK